MYVVYIGFCEGVVAVILHFCIFGITWCLGGTGAEDVSVELVVNSIEGSD